MRIGRGVWCEIVPRQRDPHDFGWLKTFTDSKRSRLRAGVATGTVTGSATQIPRKIDVNRATFAKPAWVNDDIEQRIGPTRVAIFASYSSENMLCHNFIIISQTGLRQVIWKVPVDPDLRTM